jgi:hypothetical protein
MKGHEGLEEHEGISTKSVTNADLAAACGGQAVCWRRATDMTSQELHFWSCRSRVSNTPRPATPGLPGQRPRTRRAPFMSFKTFMIFMPPALMLAATARPSEEAP